MHTHAHAHIHARPHAGRALERHLLVDDAWQHCNAKVNSSGDKGELKIHTHHIRCKRTAIRADKAQVANGGSGAVLSADVRDSAHQLCSSPKLHTLKISG